MWCGDSSTKKWPRTTNSFKIVNPTGDRNNSLSVLILASDQWAGGEVLGREGWALTQQKPPSDILSPFFGPTGGTLLPTAKLDRVALPAHLLLSQLPSCQSIWTFLVTLLMLEIHSTRLRGIPRSVWTWAWYTGEGDKASIPRDQ